MNPRHTTRIRNETLEQFPYFINKILSNTSSHTRIIVKNFSTLTIIKMLHCLENNERNASEFYLKSGVGMKRVFLRYVNLCLEFRLIQKERCGAKNVIYSVTERGKIFLDLFKID